MTHRIHFWYQNSLKILNFGFLPKKCTFFGPYYKNLNFLRNFEKSAPRQLCLDDFCEILTLFTKNLVS